MRERDASQKGPSWMLRGMANELQGVVQKGPSWVVRVDCEESERLMLRDEVDK